MAETKKEKVSPFTWVDAITVKKGDPLEDFGEKAYPAFMVNRSLSYFSDTIMYANEMNMNGHLDNKLQYDYYREAIRSKKRFGKWGKKRTSDDIQLIQEVYNYSAIKAEQALRILTPEQVEMIRESQSRGTEN